MAKVGKTKPKNTELDRELLRSRTMEAVKYWVGLGANIRARNDIGNSVLHHLSLKGKKEDLEWILEAGGEVDGVNDEGETPLMYLVGYHNFGRLAKEDLARVRVLLEHGADPRRKDEQGRSALDYLEEEDGSKDKVMAMITKMAKQKLEREIPKGRKGKTKTRL